MNEHALRTAGAGLVALVAVWAGARMYAGHNSRGPATAVQSADGVRVPVGEASPPIPSDAGDTDFAAGADRNPPLEKIPDQLPLFTLADRAGKPTPITTWRDKSLILNFWATWCTPCKREIPLLQTLASDWAGRGVQVVGIAVDHLEQVRAYADQLKIAYPLLIGEQDALDVAGQLGFKAPVFPFTVFTDRRGEVVTLFVGELHQPQVDLILSVVQNLNEKRVPIATARRAITEGLKTLAFKQS